MMVGNVMRDALKTLFHPLESDALAVPGRGQRALFLGAEPGFRLPAGFDAELVLVQGFRPFTRGLEAGGYKVGPVAQGNEYDLVLVLCGRHRGQNELRIAEAIERATSGATVLVAGSKADGIASLRRRVGEMVEIDGHLPKHHGVAFWFTCPADPSATIEALREGNGERLIEERFHTAPGMFSADGIDAGSKFLVANLPQEIGGAVADFCAGWGYLAAELAARHPKISVLDLYEADFASLEAARRNVAHASVQPGFFWQDLLSEKVLNRYDVIVMNPPFHKGRAAEPDIGQGMIRTAAAALKPGGRLYMVANRQLPYEHSLVQAFSSHAEIARDGLFKVFAARR